MLGALEADHNTADGHIPRWMSVGHGRWLCFTADGGVAAYRLLFTTSWRRRESGNGDTGIGGVAGFVSQCLLNFALGIAPSGPAVVVRSANVPLTFVLGFLFLDERPAVVSVLGVGVVLVSVAMIGLQKVWSH